MTEDQRETSDAQPDRAAITARLGLDSLLGDLPSGTLEPFVIRPAVEIEEFRQVNAADSMAMTGSDPLHSSPLEWIVDQPTRVAEIASHRNATGSTAWGAMIPSAQPLPPAPGSSLPGAEVLQSFLAPLPDVQPSKGLFNGQFDPSSLLLDVPAGRTERTGLSATRAGRSVVPGISEDLAGLIPTAFNLSSSATIVEQAMPAGQARELFSASAPVSVADVLEEFESASRPRFAASPIISGNDLLGPSPLPADGSMGSSFVAAPGPTSSTRDAGPWGERIPTSRLAAPASLDLEATDMPWNSGSIDELSGVAARLLDAVDRIEQAAERFSIQRSQAYASTPPPFRGRVDG